MQNKRKRTYIYFATSHDSVYFRLKSIQPAALFFHLDANGRMYYASAMKDVNIKTKTELTDADLLAYNQQGLIPAPEETDADFYSRVQACLGLKALLTKERDQLLPFKAELPLSSENLEEAYSLTEPLYGIRPTWIPLFFSNYHLAPWHGGCAWIFQLQTNGPRLSFLQLRKAFAARKNYLAIYQRDELVAHECAHVGRMNFNEERFEEILAYRSCRSSWRAWIGPIVQSATESLVFVILLSALCLSDLYLLMTGNYETYQWMLWFKILPVGLLLLGYTRLWLRQRTFHDCLAKLQETLGSLPKANHVIYRLSDREIALFAGMPPAAIREYAKEHSSKSLRWRQLTLAYFNFL